MLPQTNHGDDELMENHEMNVTPFIDVILVLLIIFMVAAPLATVDVNVDLPASNAVQKTRPDSPVFLTIKHDLSLALGDKVITRKDLNDELHKATDDQTDTRIFLRADKTVIYNDLMTVMNELRSAGYLKIALVSLEAAALPNRDPQ